MAVPNTATFSATDVQTNIGGGHTGLVALFANAIDDFFDPTYSGSKNSLLNFRNYGNIDTDLIPLGTGIDGSAACSDFSASPEDYYVPNGTNLITADSLYILVSGNYYLAPSNWYSDGARRREWTGTEFVGSSDLCS
jgi:hypothetical protein